MIIQCSTSAFLLLLVVDVHCLSEPARRKRVVGEDLGLRVVCSAVVIILIRISVCLL